MAPTSDFAVYLEARMERHRRWQHAEIHRLCEEVIDEVQALPRREPRHGMPLDFPPHQVSAQQGRPS